MWRVSLVPADDVLVGGLHEEELILQVHLLQAVQGLEELVKVCPPRISVTKATRLYFPVPAPAMHRPAKLVMRATGMLSTQ